MDTCSILNAAKTREEHGIPGQVIELMKPFKLDFSEYHKIMHHLQENMRNGLKKETHETAAVKMFPSYVTKMPTGKEKGTFLALDLGGTNYRVLLVTLDGSGNPPKIEETTYAIPHDKMTGTGAELFDYISDTMLDFLKSNGKDQTKMSLGFTFSFPCAQKGLDIGILVRWTKGFSAAGVEGENVAKLLQDAINKRDMKVHCVAVVNDTVGTLTACRLQDPKCAIGLIVGTGTNAAYVEKVSNAELFSGDPTATHVIINMEWGAFGEDGCLDPFRTEFDHELDKISLHPTKQIYEKMISGMYLGELVRLILARLVEMKLLFHGLMPKKLQQPGGFLTKYISETERDPPHLYYSTHYMLTEDLEVSIVNPDDDHIVRYVCELVGARAAYLAGTGIACLLNHIHLSDVTVGIDGSLFKFHPKFPERMTETIHRLKNEEIRFVLRLSEDGSGKGAAAIAAAATVSV